MNLKFKTKFIVFLLLTFLISICFIFRAQAQYKKEVNIYFFWDKDCPHCQIERAYLPGLEQKYPGQIKILNFEIYKDEESQKLLSYALNQLSEHFRGTPVTLIGPYLISGFSSAETTGKIIEQYIEICLAKNCPDLLIDLINENPNPNNNEPPEELPSQIPNTVKYPLIGEIKLNNLSLPMLTLVLGTLDGFNPCAMWILMVLIGLLLNTRSRRQMWLVGSIFILASGIVYYLFIAAWLNIFLWLGFLKITKIIISLLAIGAGLWFLKEFFTSKPGECKVTSTGQKQKITEKLKNLIKPTILPGTVLGIIIIAFTVNMIELLCSLGLPAIYTRILTLNNLANWQYYLYIAFYTLLYMIDDIIILVVAIVTLQAVGFTGKYSHYSKLIGGLLILALGFILLLRPELLIFK